MQLVEKSIDDKSHKLFIIRDEFSSLSEQARKMQYEINQLSEDQAENMNKFLLLCEHLNTCPKMNSNPEGNITPKKVAGDVPLAPSAKNISSISIDMSKPESKDKGKSQANKKDANSSKEEKNISSTKVEKIISGKSEGISNKVPSGTKVFSSFQVGKKNTKEEEYLAFTRYIYNLPEESGETFGVLGTTNLFLRISIFPNGSPDFTAQLFEFGCLDRVYTKPDLQEISKLPEHLRNSVKYYAQGDGVYCRFFSISVESKDLQLYFPTINYITLENLKGFIIKAI
ncbi:hypothetical protein H5410_037684 [Solanum commersonii]|uniref:Uncharacterized protein n=1 Tax=Solanum commersonii TaxID=4109 RepID=A0A9J5YAW9_SOLCO|nr:hypothetical protein H5410_037684 [Solanum commersonii]